MSESDFIALVHENSTHLRQKLAEFLGVSPESLAGEISQLTGLPYQTARNFVLDRDYSGRVYSLLLGTLKEAPVSLRKALAIDYITKMLPVELREETMALFNESTWTTQSM